MAALFYLICALILSFCNGKVLRYAENYEYQYIYRAVVYFTSGQMSSNEQLELRCDVSVHVDATNQYVVKIGRITWLNAGIRISPHFGFSVINEHLQLPILVQDEQVVLVSFTPKDSLHSMNIKKAMTSFMFPQIRNETTDYVVKENGPQGKCETLYTRIERANGSRFESIARKLNTSGDLTLIKRTPLTCKYERTTNMGTVQQGEGHYLVEESATISLIHQAATEEVLNWTVTEQLSQTVRTSQFLSLKNIRTNTSVALKPYSWSKTSDLRAVIAPEYYVVTNPPVFIIKEGVSRFKKVLKGLREMRSGHSSNVASQLVNLIGYLHVMSGEIMDHIFSHDELRNEPNKAEAMYQILGLVGTYDTLLFLEENMEDEEAARYFEVLPSNVVHFNEEFGNKLIQLCTSCDEQKIRGSCFLALSAILSRFCANSSTNLANFCDQAIQRMISLPFSDTNEVEKLLYVKVLKNLGILTNATFSRLSSAVMDYAVPRVVRTEAAWALSTLPLERGNSEAFKDLLWMLFSNKTEDMEIRAAAARALLGTRATSREARRLVAVLETESSNVINYVASWAESQLFRKSLVESATVHDVQQVLSSNKNLTVRQSQVVTFEEIDGTITMIDFIWNEKGQLVMVTFEQEHDGYSSATSVRSKEISISDATLSNLLREPLTFHAQSTQFLKSSGKVLITTFINGKDTGFQYVESSELTPGGSCFTFTSKYAQQSTRVTQSGFPFSLTSLSLSVHTDAFGCNSELWSKDSAIFVKSVVSLPFTKYQYGILNYATLVQNTRVPPTRVRFTTENLGTLPNQTDNQSVEFFTDTLSKRDNWCLLPC